jgi:glycine/D-amino acid oxidase-like deaminating enzyme
MPTTLDVIIIGAGIAGSACARGCALAGLKTAIVEAAQPGAAATSKGMGHVVAMDDTAAHLALTTFSRGVWQEQAATVLPGVVEYQSRGTIWVATDDEEMVEIHARLARYETAGIEVELLGAAKLAKAEPNLRPDLAGGLFVPGDGICHPPAAAAFYLADAQRLGAFLFLSRAVEAANGKVRLADGIVLHAAHIVLAVGAECDLLPALPIRKRKGHLIVTTPRPGFLHHQLVELGYLKSAHEEGADSVAFNVQPRSNGQVMIGASRQYGNEDPAIDQYIVDRLRARAHRFMPGLAGIRTDTIRAGFRAATPDKLPLLGPATGLSDDPTLWLAAGFEGLGITCAPGAAQLVVDSILGRDSSIDRTPYLPSRFAANSQQEQA